MGIFAETSRAEARSYTKQSEIGVFLIGGLPNFLNYPLLQKNYGKIYTYLYTREFDISVSLKTYLILTGDPGGLSGFAVFIFLNVS